MDYNVICSEMLFTIVIGGIKMLQRFSFRNYKSFRDEAVLELSASKIKDLSESIISYGEDKILPLAVIYGSNASGKSNVYHAFETMTEYVLYSFRYEEDSDSLEESSEEGYRPEPFLFDSISANNPTSFDINFIVPWDEKKRSFNYGFSIDKDGISNEWLNYKSKTARSYRKFFYRDRSYDTLDLMGLPEKSRLVIEAALDKHALIVSLGAKLKDEKCKMIRDWFLLNEFADFGNPFTNFFMSRTLPKNFVDDESVQDKVVRYFNTFDNQIKGFKIKKLPIETDSKEESYSIRALHMKIDSDEIADIPLGNESAGTLKMFAMYPKLQKVFQKGGILFIDELNARLHPMLVNNILSMFMDSQINVNHAQLVCTSHDTWQMSRKFLRRDQIWFTEKDSSGLSSLYSLSKNNLKKNASNGRSTSVRNDESYEKHYMEGDYGAVPKLSSIDMLLDE